MKRYSFSELEKVKNVKNGIYLLFEEGEKYHEFDRIVRVGSHPSQDRFYKRLMDHFNNNHRKSIVRKHIGRCFLQKENDPYIHIWDYTNSEVVKGSPGEIQVNKAKENELENRISKYMNKFSICVIPNLNNTEIRMNLEMKLIATLNLSSNEFISSNWLGKYHPDQKISTSGLWNIQHLNAEEFISEEDFQLIKNKVG